MDLVKFNVAMNLRYILTRVKATIAAGRIRPLPQRTPRYYRRRFTRRYGHDRGLYPAFAWQGRGPAGEPAAEEDEERGQLDEGEEGEE